MRYKEKISRVCSINIIFVFSLGYLSLLTKRMHYLKYAKNAVLNGQSSPF